MRDLTKKQKTLLTKWFKESKKGMPYETPEYTLNSVDDLTAEQWEILEEINDTEVLYQNVNCFIDDLHEAELMKTGRYD